MQINKLLVPTSDAISGKAYPQECSNFVIHGDFSSIFFAMQCLLRSNMVVIGTLFKHSMLSTSIVMCAIFVLVAASLDVNSVIVILI